MTSGRVGANAVLLGDAALRPGKVPEWLYRVFDGEVFKVGPGVPVCSDHGGAWTFNTLAGRYPASECYTTRKAAYDAAEKHLRAKVKHAEREMQAALVAKERAVEALEVLARRRRENGETADA